MRTRKPTATKASRTKATTATFSRARVAWVAPCMAAGLLLLAAAYFVQRQKRAESARTSPSAAPVYKATVLHKYAHDKQAFTQGLAFHASEPGVLYESTGLYGQSTVRKVHIATGHIMNSSTLPRSDFGEGLTHINQTHLIQVLWKVGAAYIYERATLSPSPTHTGLSDAWGVAMLHGDVYLSDGTSTIHVLRASGHTLVKRTQFTVRDGAFPVGLLNELEFVNGELWANVLFADFIVRIDIRTARVIAWVDLTNLLDKRVDVPKGHTVDVLNGIAYDERHRLVYVTGKLWPSLFAISCAFGQPSAQSIVDAMPEPFFFDDSTVQRVLNSM